MRPDDLQSPALHPGQVNFHPHTRLDRRLGFPMETAHFFLAIKPFTPPHDERGGFVYGFAVSAVKYGCV
jgi:hypothetical protein